MRERRHRYVIAYDIVDDTRRYRVANHLLDHGQRVQKSVFECTVKAEQMTQMLKILEGLLDLSQDSLRVYRLCASCSACIEVRGIGPVEGDSDLILI